MEEPAVALDNIKAIAESEDQASQSAQSSHNRDTSWAGKRAFNHVRRLSNESEPETKSDPAGTTTEQQCKPLENDGFDSQLSDDGKIEQLTRSCSFLFEGGAGRLVSPEQLSRLTSSIHTLYDCPTPWCVCTFGTGDELLHHMTKQRCQPTTRLAARIEKEIERLYPPRTDSSETTKIEVDKADKAPLPLPTTAATIDQANLAIGQPSQSSVATAGSLTTRNLALLPSYRYKWRRSQPWWCLEQHVAMLLAMNPARVRHQATQAGVIVRTAGSEEVKTAVAQGLFPKALALTGQVTVYQTDDAVEWLQRSHPNAYNVYIQEEAKLPKQLLNRRALVRQARARCAAAAAKATLYNAAIVRELRDAPWARYSDSLQFREYRSARRVRHRRSRMSRYPFPVMALQSMEAVQGAHPRRLDPTLTEHPVAQTGIMESVLFQHDTTDVDLEALDRPSPEPMMAQPDAFGYLPGHGNIPTYRFPQPYQNGAGGTQGNTGQVMGMQQQVYQIGTASSQQQQQQQYLQQQQYQQRIKQQQQQQQQQLQTQQQQQQELRQQQQPAQPQAQLQQSYQNQPQQPQQHPTLQSMTHPATQPSRPVESNTTSLDGQAQQERQRLQAQKILTQYKQLADLKKRFDAKLVSLTAEQQQSMLNAMASLERNPVIVQLRRRAALQRQQQLAAQSARS